MSSKNELVYSFIALGGLCFISAPASAVEPNPIKMGAVDVVPTIMTEVAYDDNIFRTPQLQQSSNILTINPKLQATLQSDTNIYTLDAEVIDGAYSDSPIDDYTDWRVGLGAQISLNSRNLLDFDATFFSSHERRGTGFSQGLAVPTSPFEFDKIDYGLSYQYGTSDSLGRILLRYSFEDIEYTNSRLLTITRDREASTASATLFLNVLANNDFLFEYRFSEISYDTPSITGSLDSEESYFFIGAEWNATARLTGSARVGYGKKEFISSARDESEIPSWEVSIAWAPLTYSIYTFTTSNSFAETTGFSDSIETQLFGLNWRHDWSGRFSSTLSAQYDDRSFVGSLRNDTREVFSASMNYGFARWLDLNLSYSYEDNESAATLFDYQQSVVSLGLEVSL